MAQTRHTNGRAPRPDRDLIKRAFVEAPPGPDAPTIAGLALEHGRSPKALQAPAACEGWTALRAEHRRKIEEARQAALVEAAAGAAAEFDDQSIKVARAALGRAARFLTEEGQAGTGRQGSSAAPALKPADLLAVANAVRTLQQVVHAAVGTPDERPDGAERRRWSWADVMALAGRLDDTVDGKPH